MAPCHATTKSGTPCKASAIPGTNFCSSHKKAAIVPPTTPVCEPIAEMDEGQGEAVPTAQTAQTVEAAQTVPRGTKRAKSAKSTASGSTGVTSSMYSSELYESDATETLENVNAKLEQIVNAVGKFKTQLKTMEQEAESKAKNKNKTKKSPGERKPWEMTDKRALTSARWAYYREHKDDIAIIADIRNMLIASNKLTIKKSTNKDGETVEKEIIPYGLIKIETDKIFDNKLSNRQRTEWVNKATKEFETRKEDKAAGKA